MPEPCIGQSDRARLQPRSRFAEGPPNRGRCETNVSRWLRTMVSDYAPENGANAIRWKQDVTAARHHGQRNGSFTDQIVAYYSS